MLRKSKSTYRYYKSIDFLPIFNFFKIIETDDIRFLLKIEDYETFPNDIDLKELKKAWENITDEYSKAENSNSSIIQFTTSKSVHKLELEYLMLFNLHNLIVADQEGSSAKAMIKYAGLEDKSIEWIRKRIKTLTNKIKLKRKNNDKLPKSKKDDYWRIIDEIEDIKGRQIDIFKTTVHQYIAIKKNIKNGKRQDRKK